METATHTPLAIMTVLAFLVVLTLLILVVIGLQALLLGRDIICTWTVPLAVWFGIELCAAAARMWRSGALNRAADPRTWIRLTRRYLHGIARRPTRTHLILPFSAPVQRSLPVPHYQTVGERFRQRRAA